MCDSQQKDVLTELHSLDEVFFSKDLKVRVVDEITRLRTLVENYEAEIAYLSKIAVY